MSISKEEVYALLLKSIENAEFKVGEKIPTERVLSKKFKTPQWRVHLAINELEENGFIERNRSAGTFIRKDICLNKVSIKKNSISKRIIISLSKNFYFQTENYHDIIGDLERELEKSGYDIVYSNFPNSRNELKIFLDEFANNAKSLIIFPENAEWDLMHLNIDLLNNYLGNIFYFNRGKGTGSILPFNSISLDFYASGRCAGDWIISKDFKNIAYCTECNNFYWATERYSGFKHSLYQKKLNHILFRNELIEELYSPIAEYIKKCDSIPVIVCLTDEMAVKISSQMRLEGLTLGKDFILIGFDNHPKYRTEKLVSIAWPLNRLGEIIADSVLTSNDDKFHELKINKYQILPVIFDRIKFEGVLL